LEDERAHRRRGHELFALRVPHALALVAIVLAALSRVVELGEVLQILEATIRALIGVRARLLLLGGVVVQAHEAVVKAALHVAPRAGAAALVALRARRRRCGLAAAELKLHLGVGLSQECAHRRQDHHARLHRSVSMFGARWLR
jgi:hypothetical protein